NARRPSSTAATDADASPPKGSHTTSPGPVTALTCRRMNSSGFWFKCAADCTDGLCTRGAERSNVPLNRSESWRAGLWHTLVSPWTWFHLYRRVAHSSAVTERSPSSEKNGRSRSRPCSLAYAGRRATISPGGQYQSQPAVRYFRVAAFLTPHASFALYSGRPLRCHS